MGSHPEASPGIGRRDGHGVSGRKGDLSGQRYLLPGRESIAPAPGFRPGVKYVIWSDHAVPVRRQGCRPQRHFRLESLVVCGLELGILRRSA
jgi:hypothetical protein